MSGGHWNYGIPDPAYEDGDIWEDVELDGLWRDLVGPGDFGVRPGGGLLQSADFWKSGDIDEAAYREKVSAFKRKWLRAGVGAVGARYRDALRADFERYMAQMGEGE